MFGDARVVRLASILPIRSRSAEEGSFEIPWWGIPLVLIVLYVCLFSGLGAIGLVGPDEPRYAAIARAMAETHDWVTPRLWGTPWFEKPVLYYWTAGIAMRIFGVSEFAARLPSACAGLLAVIAVAWTALRSYGLGAAWYSLLMLPTSVAMIGFSRAAGPDMLFAALLTASMAVAVEMLQKERPGPFLQVAFGFFLGAAVLAKGPAAVILAGGATLLWAAITRQWRAPFRFLHPLVIAAFCATALPWYVLCAIRNPDFLNVFIWQHNFKRYLTPIFQHPQPFWFYVPILGMGIMPWVVLICAPVSRRWRKTRLDSPGVCVLCWALFPLFFFSLSQSKLPGYILPAIPPAFLLIGRVASVEDARQLFSWVGLTASVIALFAAGSYHALYGIGDLLGVSDSRVTALIALAVLSGVLPIALLIFKKPRHAFVALPCFLAILVLFLNLRALPTADSRISARHVSQDYLRLNASGADIACAGITRDWKYGMSYYLNRELSEWTPGMPPPEWLLTTAGNATALGRAGGIEVSHISEPFAVLVRMTPRENIQP